MTSKKIEEVICNFQMPNICFNEIFENKHDIKVKYAQLKLHYKN